MSPLKRIDEAGYRGVFGVRSDEDWGNYPFFFFAIAVVAMTAVLLIGVVVGILARTLWRSRPYSLDSG